MRNKFSLRLNCFNSVSFCHPVHSLAILTYKITKNGARLSAKVHTFPLFHIGAELTLASDSVYGMEGMNVVICVMHARHNLERNVSVNIQLIEDSAGEYILKCAVYTPSSPFDSVFSSSEIKNFC